MWIDGGLHASEVLCAQALAETVYRFVSSNDEETLRILNDVVILFVHANPDDYRTDPSGNAGARLACAVIAPAR